jgi:hypothetical protein
MAYTPPDPIIVNFTEGGYSPPPPTGFTYEFAETQPSDVYQLSPDLNDNGYLYAATNVGLIIIDVDSEQEFARVSSTVCTSVWNSDTLVFMGTTGSGIWALDKSTISSGDLTSSAYQYRSYPNITSDDVKYLHGQSDYLCATTAVGVDFIWISLADWDSRTIDNAYKCFVCSDGKTYFTTSGTPNKIYRSNVPLGVSSTPVEYTCGSGDLTNVPNVRDIYVTERTSSVETVLWPENTLFIAASGSAFIFDEGTKELSDYRIGGPT